MIYKKLKFNQKLKRIVRIKNLIIFCLILLLIWWAGTAILKYWSQPLTTDTMNVFGDNDKGIQFPLIAICDYDFQKNPLMKDCYTDKHNFISSFVSCMKEDKNFLIESFLRKIILDWLSPNLITKIGCIIINVIKNPFYGLLII